MEMRLSVKGGHVVGVSSVVRPGPYKVEIAIPRSTTLTVTFFAHIVLHRQSFPTMTSSPSINSNDDNWMG